MTPKENPMFTTLLALFFTIPTASSSVPVCEFHMTPPPGCDVDGPDPKIKNCMLVENHSDLFAEIGIDGICPVGSGRAAFTGGVPAYIDFVPADPTVGARPVMPPRTKVYIFHNQGTMQGTFRADLYTQASDFPVTDAQFVPAVTYVAPPRTNGPVRFGSFSAAYNMYGRGSNWVRIRD